MAKTKLTYQKALKEIESIVDEIENGDPDVDQIGVKIERAVELVKFCKESIRNTDEQISKAMKELDD